MIPNLFLIGGMRCGSTALHLLLNQHYDINMSSKKEPYFFVAELKRQELKKKYSKDLAVDLNNYLKEGKYRTLDKYISLFDKKRNYKYRGESSHYIYNPKTAKIIKKESPNAKIIISIRNPIDRLFSEYCLKQRKNENMYENFDSFVKENIRMEKEKKPSKLSKGLYYESLCQWIKIFGKEKIKVVLYSDFKQFPQKVLSDIFHWLNIPEFKINNLTPQRTGKIRFKKLFYFLNSSKFTKLIFKFFFSTQNRILIRSNFYKFFIAKTKSIEMSAITKKHLIDFYKKDIHDLENLLNKNLSFWLN